MTLITGNADSPTLQISPMATFTTLTVLHKLGAMTAELEFLHVRKGCMALITRNLGRAPPQIAAMAGLAAIGVGNIETSMSLTLLKVS